jgi:NADH dehydrogenase
VLFSAKIIIFNEFETLPKVKGYENIFSIGDQCLQTNDERYPYGHPQVAQVAIQQAEQLAGNLKNIEQNKPLKAFRYKDLGSMATVGRNKAVVEMGKIKMKRGELPG